MGRGLLATAFLTEDPVLGSGSGCHAAAASSAASYLHLELGPPLAAPGWGRRSIAAREAAWAPYDFLGTTTTATASKSSGSRCSSASFLGLTQDTDLLNAWTSSSGSSRAPRTAFTQKGTHGNLSVKDEEVLVEATQAEAKAEDMAVKADNILDEAIKAAHVSKKAVKIAWLATFMACVTGSIATIGTGVDWMILRRDKRGIEEQREELAATGWPTWRLQLEAQRLGLQPGPGADPFLLDPTSPHSNVAGTSALTRQDPSSGEGLSGGSSGGAPSGSPPPPPPPPPPAPPGHGGGGSGGGNGNGNGHNGPSSIPPKAFPVPPKAGSSAR
mmetsp:Transcript_88768/g.185583  ORF Transcript_88768/g.185583 Transcript_88768/m.185583 type:complete len:329 (-) Transcript_88768:67-1053(-)